MTQNKDKKKKKFSDEWIDEVLESDGQQEKWESGELGRDPAFAKVSDRPKDASPVNPPTSIRLPLQLREALKALAEEEGLKYQAYIRMILTKHVKSKKAS